MQGERLFAEQSQNSNDMQMQVNSTTGEDDMNDLSDLFDGEDNELIANELCRDTGVVSVNDLIFGLESSPLRTFQMSPPKDETNDYNFFNYDNPNYEAETEPVQYSSSPATPLKSGESPFINSKCLVDSPMQVCVTISLQL